MSTRFTILVIILISMCLLLIDSQPNQVVAQTASLPDEAVSQLREELRQGILPPRLENSTPPASQVFSPSSTNDIASWSKVVFQSYRDNNYEVYLSDGGGGNQQRLTLNPAYDGLARLNIGSTDIVFTSKRDGNYEIYRMKIDGSGLQRLTNNKVDDLKPAWSPDGQQIVFTSKLTGKYEIYAMHADGSGLTRLTHNDVVNYYDPAWSPDGKYIAYVGVDNKNKSWLYAMNANGSNPYLIYPLALHDLENLVWSRDGTRILADYEEYYPSDPFTQLAFFEFKGLNSDAMIHNLGNSPDSPNNPDIPYEDQWAGGFSPDGEDAVFTDAYYTLSGSTLYLSSTYIDTKCILVGTQCKRLDTAISSTGYDMIPDWQSADIDPPISYITPLPLYSPSTGYSVSWSGQQTGLAPITGFTLNWKSSSSQDWEDLIKWLYFSPFTWAIGGTPGDTQYFRSSATDEAGNVEPWPTNPPWKAKTTLYTWQLSGRVADQRGVPQPYVPVSISPAPINDITTSSDGTYLAWMKTTGNHTLSATAPGQGTLPATTEPLNLNLNQDLFLPPNDNLIQNGNFEADSLTGWTVQGDLPAKLVTDTWHSGQQAVTLGSDCAYPCIADPDLLPNADQSRQIYDAATAADAAGNLYVVYLSAGGTFSITRSPQGIWSASEKISDPGLQQANSKSDIESVQIYSNQIKLLTQEGTQIAVWVNIGYGWRYAEKPSGGSWSTADTFPMGNVLDVAVNSQGGFHAIAYSMDDPYLYYIYKSPSGSWQTPVRIAPSNQSGTQRNDGAHSLIHVLKNQGFGVSLAQKILGHPSSLLSSRAKVFFDRLFEYSILCR